MSAIPVGEKANLAATVNSPDSCQGSRFTVSFQNETWNGFFYALFPAYFGISAISINPK